MTDNREAPISCRILVEAGELNHPQDSRSADEKVLDSLGNQGARAVSEDQ
jgi:hypothetical protein